MPGLVILGAVELLHLQLPHHPGDWPVLWRCQYQRCSLHSEWYSQILSNVDDFLLLEAGQPTDYDQGDMNIFYFVRIRTINSIELLCWNYRKIAKIFFFYFQIQLLAILYNKECDLVLNTQLLGFLPSIFVGFGSLTHLHYAQHSVKAAAFSWSSVIIFSSKQ